MKSLTMDFGELPGWRTRGDLGNVERLERVQKLHAVVLCPVYLFHLAVLELYPYIVKQ